MIFPAAIACRSTPQFVEVALATAQQTHVGLHEGRARMTVIGPVVVTTRVSRN